MASLSQKSLFSFHGMIMSDATDAVVDIAAKHNEIIKYKRELMKSFYI